MITKANLFSSILFLNYWYDGFLNDLRKLFLRHFNTSSSKFERIADYCTPSIKFTQLSGCILRPAKICTLWAYRTSFKGEIFIDIVIVGMLRVICFNAQWSRLRWQSKSTHWKGFLIRILAIEKFNNFVRTILKTSGKERNISTNIERIVIIAFIFLLK